MSANGHHEPESIASSAPSDSILESNAMHEPGRSMVDIIVNNKSYQIHRGRRTVVEIKTLAYIPLADELEQVLSEEAPPLRPIADDAAITIKGGEVFLSHPRDSASSSTSPRANSTWKGR